MLNPKNTCYLGSDPEGFLKLNGKIIGSEKVVAQHGMYSSGNGTVVRDGVQFEFNPIAASTPLDLAVRISGLFQTLQTAINKKDRNIEICFDGMIEVDREELDSLCEECRILGCMPSNNVYGEKPIMVDAKTYRKRSAGGHIHFGFYDYKMREDRRRIVPVCDVLIGLFATLLDRDPGAAERRENYGRAGEFRQPSHGLEYRTTSNFWLRDYVLFSFVFGMANAVHDLTYQVANGNKTLWNDLVASVKIQQVEKAINKSDFKLATTQVKRLVPFLKKNLPPTGYPLTPKNIDKFLSVATQVENKGIETFFPTETIVKNWINRNFTPFELWLEKV